MSGFKKCVMKIMPKSPTRYLVRLQGNLKLIEKEKNLYIHKFLLYISIFRCTRLQTIAAANLGRRIIT
jgi:hypothetical protein